MLAEPPTTLAGPKAGPAQDWLRALQLTQRLEAAPWRILAVAIEELAAVQGEAPALLSERECFTFAELADRAARYAAWASGQGLGKGDVVALMMPNRPEYMAIWLGLGRVGVVAALINPQLRGPSLAHCLGLARPRAIVVDASLEEEMSAAAETLGLVGAVWRWGEGRAPWPRVDIAVETCGPLPPAGAGAEAVTLKDPALLIYTSGTTGLPKAANVSHHRVMSWSHWFAGLMDIGPEDRLYDCLPLCHSAGGVAAVGAALSAGASAVIVEKFSARRFWDEVTDWNCTLFQYIGELCRYLVAAPPHPKERAHGLRLCCGNGLTADVWEAFQARFTVPRILEFYASTEGAFSLFNVEGRPGAVGRLPGFLAHRFPAAIVAFDPETGAPWRGPEGHCRRCGAGEAGEAIGRVSEAGAARFEGYTDPAATEARLMRDVFEPGDLWVRTGDLMRRDAEGFFHFVDRIGDTFRWKGENVAAAEVAAALRACPGVEDACVYGVAVPGASGKAGMAALAVGADFEPAALRERLARALPDYARPVFLRLAASLDLTETFKLKTAGLAAEGWDPDEVGDLIYFDDRAAGAYAPLTASIAAAIRAGRVRL